MDFNDISLQRKVFVRPNHLPKDLTKDAIKVSKRKEKHRPLICKGVLSKAEEQSKSFCSKTENLHPPETLTGNKREMSKEEAVLYNKAVCTMSGNVCNAVEKKSRQYCTTISGNVCAWGDRECNMVSAMHA